VKKTILLFILALGLSTNSNAQAWAQLPNYPGLERDDGVAFVINNKAYCGTGLQVGFSPTKDFYSLDLTTETWTTVAPMPPGKERQYACAFTNGTDAFVFGGEAGGTDLNDCWMYMPSLNSWMAVASKPGNGVRGAAYFVIGNTAYLIGGAYSSTNALNEVWAYNMSTDTWTQKNNLPFACWRSSATVVSGKGYLLFGREANGRFRKELFEYDPTADSWTLINNFPGAGRAYATMQNVNNDLVVFGGLDTLNNYYNTVWNYYIPSAQWTQLPTLPSFGRKGGMGFANNNILYYTCGIDQTNTRLKETWKTDLGVGIKELEKEEKVLVYPNPASDFIILKFPINSQKEVTYKIFDSRGSDVLTGTLNETHKIDVKTLSQGIYQLLAGTCNSRIIIQ
jgi:N-acetylneuraminic acid mutarotase